MVGFRNKGFKLLPLLLAGCILMASQGAIAARTAAMGSKPVITIALVDTFSPDFYLHTYVPTVDYLRTHLPQYEFKIKEIDYRDVDNGIKNVHPDFLFSSASTFGELGAFEGAHQVATKKNTQEKDAAHSLSSLFIVPAASPIHDFAEMRGRTVAITDSQSFDGWQIAKGEISKHGQDPDRFFSEVYETHYGIPDVATLVSQGFADVGVLSTCEFESMEAQGQIKRQDFRLIGVRKGISGCLRSTDQYPDVVISSMPWVSSDVMRDMTIAILSMPRNGRNFDWVVESDFQPTMDLLKSLKIGPYRYLRDMSPQGIWKRYKAEILLTVALLLAVIFHIVTLNILVRRRTAELTQALETTRRLYNERRQSHQKILNLERNSIVSQLSSMFAHEIKQPIMNISLYAASLKMYLKRAGILKEKPAELLEALESEVERSSAIVEHVRSYAKSRPTERKDTALEKLIEDALKTFPELPPCVRVDTSGHYPVHADPFEIQFIIANFIKNSLSAIEGKKDGAILVRISDLGESWKVSVSDNGPGISDETLVRLRKGEAGQSSKTDGLGFGLAIASMLAERNGGHLEYNQLRAGGLEASLIIGKNTNRINQDTKPVSGDHQA